jgi:hypothetical protein
VAWAPFDDAWCTDPAGLSEAVAAVDPDEVVLSLQGDTPCALALLGALRGRHVVAVADPASAAADALIGADDDVTVVDPVRLVGTGAELRLVCEWWEACDGDGRIAVRGPDGTLTAPGLERVARMVVAAL